MFEEFNFFEGAVHHANVPLIVALRFFVEYFASPLNTRQFFCDGIVTLVVLTNQLSLAASMKEG